MVQLAFLLFSSAVALAFFAGSLILLNLGRGLGARRLAREGPAAMAGLNAVEGAVFALVGLLLAFAISGALQRFRRTQTAGLAGSECHQQRVRSARLVGKRGEA